MDNAGEHVLITCGAAGIGAAIAARCRADGILPVVIDRTGNGILADLSNPAETARALDEALSGGTDHPAGQQCWHCLPCYRG